MPIDTHTSCSQPIPVQRPTSGKSTPESLDAVFEQKQLDARLARIRYKFLVMSGKGGVGKSTVAANLAVALTLAGHRVGLLDVDIHGPSIPGILNLGDETVTNGANGMLPIETNGLKVMSIGFLLPNKDDALIWRGPMKMGVIKQFLRDVDWGDLDFLIIDAPPGTGDEPLSVCQLAAPLDGAVIVTTPQQVATADVRKSITFCRHLKLPVLGVVENMSGFACPHCGTVTDIFKSGGGERLASEMETPFLGRIPIDPAIGDACDAGTPFACHQNRTAAAQAFAQLLPPFLALMHRKNKNETHNGDQKLMKIAIPMANGNLCLHFGHCEQFALFDVEEKARQITGTQMLTPPPHEPGVLPRWLLKQGASLIIAGGMGQRAQALFAENGIKVVVGAEGQSPEQLVMHYLNGTLVSGANVCDH